MSKNQSKNLTGHNSTIYGLSTADEFFDTVGDEGWNPASVPIEDAIMAPVDWLVPDPEQPRQYFDPDEMAKLAVSIRELAERKRGIKGSGILQAILARRDDNSDEKLIITDGERRWRASIEAGLKFVPVIVTNATSEEAYEMALLANIHRTDLTDMELAVAYRALMNQLGMGVRRFADKIGKNRGEVYNRLSLLNLEEEAQAVITKRSGTITLLQNAARIKDKDTRLKLYEEIKQGASLDSVMKAVKAWEKIHGTPRKTTTKIHDPYNSNNESSSSTSRQSSESIEDNETKDEDEPDGTTWNPNDNEPHIDKGVHGHGPGPNTLPKIPYFVSLEAVITSLAAVEDAMAGVPPTPTLHQTRTVPLLAQIRAICDSIESKSQNVIERRSKGK